MFLISKKKKLNTRQITLFLFVTAQEKLVEDISKSLSDIKKELENKSIDVSKLNDLEIKLNMMNESFKNSFVEISELKQENKKLKQKNSELKQEVAELKQRLKL